MITENNRQPVESSMENGTHYRTCHLCEAMCGVAIHVRDGAITSIRGDDNDPLSKGYICPKAVALQDLHEDPDRLRKPVRRVGDRWQDMEWEDALDLVQPGAGPAGIWRRVSVQHHGG